MHRVDYSKEKEYAKKSIYKDCGSFVEIDGVDTFVVDKGKGQVVLLIHGLLASVYTWRKVIDSLAERFRVIAIDLKGCGFSEKPKERYSIDIFSKQIIKFMELYHIDKASLVGNSLGGEIALNAAIKFPEKITKLVLINSAGYKMEKKRSGKLIKISAVPFIDKFLGLCMTKRTIKRIAEYLLYNTDAIDERFVESYYRPLKQNGGMEGLICLCKELSSSEFKYDDVKNINIPTLIMWGEEDKLLKVSDAYNMNKDIKSSKLVVIPKCGHAPQEECPTAVSREIIEFLSDN